MSDLKLVANNGTSKVIARNLKKPEANDTQRMLVISEVLKTVQDSKLRNDLEQAFSAAGWSYAFRCNE